MLFFIPNTTLLRLDLQFADPHSFLHGLSLTTLAGVFQGDFL